MVEDARMTAFMRWVGRDFADYEALWRWGVGGPEGVRGAVSVGAVWWSAAPEFGARSVIDRFEQIKPKVLLTVDGYRYNGRDFDRREVVAMIEAEIPSLEHVVVLPYLDGEGGNWDELVAEPG